MESTNSNQYSHERSALSSRSSQRPNTHRVPSTYSNSFIYLQKYASGTFACILDIGDRVLTAPQRIGRIITIPDTEIAMVQFDHILST